MFFWLIYNFLIFFFIVNLFFSIKPGHTVIYFIGLVILFSFLLFIFSMEFFAFSLFFIYVGGIMVLFIFLIMMLGDFYPTFFKKKEIIQNQWNLLLVKLGFIISLFLGYICFLIYINNNNNIEVLNILSWYDLAIYKNKVYISYFHTINVESELVILGIFLFNFFWGDLILISVLLLLAMLGPITLLFIDKSNSKSKKLIFFNQHVLIKNIKEKI